MLILILQRQIKQQEKWRRDESGNLEKEFDSANNISFEQKIQSELGQTVDTMIRARASRNDVF